MFQFRWDGSRGADAIAAAGAPRGATLPGQSCCTRGGREGENPALVDDAGEHKPDKAELCAATGGAVVRGRCHPAERSLFLQPFVDALRPALAGLQRDALMTVVRGHETAWISLLPDLGGVLRGAAAPPADHDLQRRATYDAVLAALRRLAVVRPIALLVDDLQDAGAATLGSSLLTAPTRSTRAPPGTR